MNQNAILLLIVSFSLRVFANCPEGYVFVNGNEDLGTDDFCVMKYEAKKGTNSAVSVPQGKPWTYITPQKAKNSCRRNGRGFNLISNAQWMTVAREIELNEQNWSGGEVLSGMLNRGNSVSVNADGPVAIDPLNDFGGTLGSPDVPACGNYFQCPPGWDQKRSHHLANGEKIYDLSGNAIEWVDWQTGGTLYQPVVRVEESECSYTRRTVYQPSCSYVDARRDVAPLNEGIHHFRGIGVFYGDYLGGVGSSAGRIAAQARGGDFSSLENAGIYTLMLLDRVRFSSIGFRCVKNL